LRFGPRAGDTAGRLDLTFEDMGEQTLKNIGRRVQVYRVDDIAAVNSTSPPTSLVPLDGGLPFQNITDDPEQEYFGDGMVEEIIIALSRIRWLFVLAPSPTSGRLV
jgi:adenylate cyclase